MLSSTALLSAPARWSDAFDYEGALRAPMRALRGSWSANGSAAVTSTARTQHPLVVAPWPMQQGVLRALLPAGGSGAIYPRVVDADNWIRLRWRRFTESEEVTEYEWQQAYYGSTVVPTDDPDHVDHTSLFILRWSTSKTVAPSFPTYLAHDGYIGATRERHYHEATGSPVWTGNSRTSTAQSDPKDNLVLDTMIGGVITSSRAVDAVLASSWQVDLHPDQVALRGIAAFSTTDFEDAPYAGFGFGPSELHGSTIDTFSIALT